MNITLQNILLPDNNICDIAGLYYHTHNDRILFDGYFNLFYVEKHKKYCDISSLTLHLTAKGYHSLILMHNRDEIALYPLTPQTTTTYAFEFPYARYLNGVFSFSLVKSNTVSDSDTWVSGYYAGECETPKAVNISVAICTYHREDYVKKNLRTLRDAMNWNQTATDKCTPEVADHLFVNIIDNGRTLSSHQSILDIVSSCSGHITITENANTGGTGGFHAGMQKAIDDASALSLTHCLLMDDDATWDADLFTRLFGLLATLRDAYSNLTIGGSYLREDAPYIQQAAGEWFRTFTIENKMPLLDLRTYENCTCDDMCTTAHEHSLYSGWWCCCYPIETIRKEPAPLPLFIRHDDIQYGMHTTLRNGIVFLNGISIWHKGAHSAFQGVNFYYDIRNSLITTALFEGTLPVSRIKRHIRSHLLAAITDFRYADADLIYRGVVDFLRGPKHLLKTNPEALHKELSLHYAKAFPAKPMEIFIADGLVTKEDVLLADARYDQYRLRPADRYPSRYEVAQKAALLNGLFLPQKQKPFIRTPIDGTFDGFRCNRILLYEPVSGKAYLCLRKDREAVRVVRMIHKCEKMIDKYFDRASAAYRAWYAHQYSKGRHASGR